MLQRAWQRRGLLACALWPVSLLFRAMVALRRTAYETGRATVHPSALPVIVVGNLAVGGTGKTPLTALLVTELQRRGWHPAIVSRGYGGADRTEPHLVQLMDRADEVGDEPLMLARQCKVPVCICPNRAAAVAQVANETEANLVLSDDGLQHHGMARDVEIVVVDGARGFGNGWLLPAGPMREPPKRIRHADLIAVQLSSSMASNATLQSMLAATPDLLRAEFSLTPGDAINLATQQTRSLDSFIGSTVHAMAGTGYPERFFAALRAVGLSLVEHPMVDHQRYTLSHLEFGDDAPVLVTSKDAVKLRDLDENLRHVYEVPASIQPTASMLLAIDHIASKLRVSAETAASAPGHRHRGAS